MGAVGLGVECLSVGERTWRFFFFGGVSSICYPLLSSPATNPHPALRFGGLSLPSNSSCDSNHTVLSILPVHYLNSSMMVNRRVWVC